MSYTLIRRPKMCAIPANPLIKRRSSGQRVVLWTDATGKRRSSLIAGKRMIVGPGEWSAQFVTAQGKRTTKALHTTDRRVAERKAAELANEARDLREGRTDPREGKLRLEGARLILEHLAEFRDMMTAKGRTLRHVRETCNMVERLVTATKAERLSDLDDDRIRGAIDVMRDTRFDSKDSRLLSARRKNAHIVAVKAFSAWATTGDRIRLDPLRNLKKEWNEKEDARLVRRELLPEELARLLEATKNGKKHSQSMEAKDRVILYALAFTTGLRRGELESLTVGSFKLDDKVPAVVVKASETKNGDEARQPLSPDLVARLRPWLTFKTTGVAVFPTMPNRTANMIRRDLALARAAWEAEDPGPGKRPGLPDGPRF